MTREEAKEFIVQSIKDDIDVAKIVEAIGVIEHGPETENDILKALMDDCDKRSGCKGCKYLNNDALRCRFIDIPITWEVE